MISEIPEHLSRAIQTPNKYGRLVLAPSSRPDAFDCLGVDCAFPFFHEGSFYMTYVGWDGRGYRTGLATSNNLISWKKRGLLLDRGPVGSLTEHNISLTCILRENTLFGPGSLRRIDGRYVGTYHAYPDPGYEQGPAVIGLCYSKDLQEWVLDSPALFAQDGGDWEAGGLYKSWLMEHDGTFFLFYNAKNECEGEGWVEQTGVATSQDLKVWRRHPRNPLLPAGRPGDFDDRFASDPCVLFHDGVWLMFYFGNSSDGHARDGVAWSEDLVTWKKSGKVLIDVGQPGEIDSLHAHKPGMIATGNRLFHFYTAVQLVAPHTINGIESVKMRGITFATNEFPESGLAQPVGECVRQ